MNEALYTKITLRRESPDFRIGAVISDGMWYSLTKWRKISRVSEEEINEWIDKHLSNGTLIQSETGAKSYRFPLKSILQWYSDHNIPLGTQLIDSIFPPRIWDNMTEAEGFMNAPLRQIGVVSFNGNSEIADIISESLRGIAKVREVEPGKYKAYCLNANYVKQIVEEELDKNQELLRGTAKKIYSRSEAKRREIVDFTPEFANGLVMFYKTFGKTLVKKEMETIQIFLPDPEDQDSQITLWVLTAIEKFDESTAVPFSGYLNSVLKRWPYDLPSTHLGKDLSSFQRQRSKAVDRLKEKYGEEKNFSNIELAEAMEMEQSHFNDLEEKHKVWSKSRKPASLTWDENSDEKMIEPTEQPSSASDIVLAHKLSKAIVQTACNTGLHEDAFAIIAQIDASEINMAQIDSVSESFIQELGVSIGMTEGE